VKIKLSTIETLRKRLANARADRDYTDRCGSYGERQRVKDRVSRAARALETAEAALARADTDGDPP